MRIYIVWILFFAKFLIRMPRDELQNLSGLLIKLDIVSQKTSFKRIIRILQENGKALKTCGDEYSFIFDTKITDAI